MKKSFLLFLLATVQPVFSQTKLDNAIANLEKFDNQEKVYLLTDKSQYVAGDQIWFKGFVFQGYNRSIISTTLFVELYNADKKLIDTKTILIQNGEGFGDFKLKDNLPEQVYYLRAYTPNMSLLGNDFQIAKSLPIYNANATEKLDLIKDSNWSANVYPEGGTFVADVPTKVAVRMFTSNSFPEKWNGKIVDVQNPTVAITSFSSFDKNVATFTMTPKLGKKYQALIQDASGKKKTIDFPIVTGNGISLAINSGKDGVKYSLRSINLPQQLQNYKIIATINNQMVYRANINKLVSEAESTIPTKVSNEKNAVLQLAIFDDQDKMVAQRLCFIKPNNLAIEKADVIGRSIKQTPGSFNSIDLSPESHFKNYTVVVKDADNSTADDENSILSSLWLTGDFTSTIDAPAHYFSPNANAEALDALLISEKWKRFDWNSLLTGNLPKDFIPDQKFLSYRIKPIKNNSLLKNTTVNLAVKLGEGDGSINPFVTDANGYLYLDNLNFNEPLSISAFANKDKSKEFSADDLSISVEPLVKTTTFEGIFPPTKYHLVKNNAPQNNSIVITRAFKNQKNNKTIEEVDAQIEEVKVVGKKKDPKQELNEKLSTGRFNSINTTIFDFVNEDVVAPGSMSVLDWLQGRAAGLTFQKNSSNDNVPYIRNKQAKLYLDEMPVEPSMITSIPISNIAMVKIIKDSGLLGGDAVAIYTMRGDMKSKNDNISKKSFNTAIIKGYDKPSEFTIEMLDSDSTIKVENDTRETLYWNPNLFESDYTPPRIKFYNNDSAKQYKVQIISFDKDDNILFDNFIVK